MTCVQQWCVSTLHAEEGSNTSASGPGTRKPASLDRADFDLRFLFFSGAGSLESPALACCCPSVWLGFKSSRITYRFGNNLCCEGSPSFSHASSAPVLSPSAILPPDFVCGVAVAVDVVVSSTTCPTTIACLLPLADLRSRPKKNGTFGVSAKY